MLVTVGMFFSLFIFIFTLGGCSQPHVIDVAIGSTWSRLMANMADAYTSTHPGTRVEVSSVGTGPAFKLLERGDVQLVGAARDPIPAERERFDLVRAAQDTLAIVTHVQSTLPDDLSLEELRDLYTTKNEQGITRIKKAAAHGTAVAFANSIAVGLRDVYGENEAGSNSEVLLLASRIEDSVGYVSSPDAIQAQADGLPIRILTIDGLSPLDISGSPTTGYPLVRTLWLATRKGADMKSATDRKAAYFIEFLTTEQGQAAFRAAGFRPLLEGER